MFETILESNFEWSLNIMKAVNILFKFLFSSIQTIKKYRKYTL